MISFVIPCYRSESTIEIVVEEIIERMSAREESYEIIMVNDYSPDKVWNKIQAICSKYDNCMGINLSKNFGQHSALLAGYSKCSGEYVVSLDDDGQTPLDSLDKLLEKCYEGYDVVYAYYKEIKQKLYRRFGTWMAKKLGEVMLGQPKDMKGSSFYVARKFVIDEMIKYNNSYPYLGGLVLRTTRSIACVETEHRERLSGKSGYSFKALLNLWINGFTAFSVKPLEVSTYLGILFAISGFIYAIITIFRRFFGQVGVEGWSSIVALLLIIGGMILVMLGLIGEYIGRIYICINNSPQYVIKETTEKSMNKEKEND